MATAASAAMIAFVAPRGAIVIQADRRSAASFHSREHRACIFWNLESDKHGKFKWLCMVHASHAATLSLSAAKPGVMYMHEHGREEGWRRTRRRSISPLPRTNVDMAFNHGGYNLGGGVLCASMTVLTFTATLLTLPSAVGGEGASLPTGSHFVMPPGNPTADPAAVVIAGGARFTVLANALVRMEWKDAQGSWNDMQTMVVFNRRTPLPQFNHTPLPHQGEMRA